MKMIILRGMSLLLIFTIVASCTNPVLSDSFGYGDSQYAVGQTHKMFVIYKDSDLFLDESNCTKASIDSLGKWLRDNPGIKLAIEVYTDSRGDDNFNLTMSTRRAQEVAYYLSDKCSISSKRITPIGMGEKSPVYTMDEIKKMKTLEEQELAYAHNRRTIARITSIE